MFITRCNRISYKSLPPLELRDSINPIVRAESFLVRVCRDSNPYSVCRRHNVRLLRYVRDPLSTRFTRVPSKRVVNNNRPFLISSEAIIDLYVTDVAPTLWEYHDDGHMSIDTVVGELRRKKRRSSMPVQVSRKNYTSYAIAHREQH